MQYTSKQLGLQFVVFCLVLALTGGCKTMGSRTLDDQEEKPSRAKRAGVIAIAVLGVAAGVFGGVKLAKAMLRSNFDDALADYKQLLKKSMRNPDDKQVAQQLEIAKKDVVYTIEMGGNTKEYLGKFRTVESELMQKSKRYKKLKIRNIEGELGQLEAGKLDVDVLSKIRSNIYKKIPDPRKSYSVFDEYVIATKKSLLKEGMSQRQIDDLMGRDLPKNVLEDMRVLWDNHDRLVDDQLRIEKSRTIEKLKESLKNELKHLRQLDS